MVNMRAAISFGILVVYALIMSEVIECGPTSDCIVDNKDICEIGLVYSYCVECVIVW